MQILHTGARFSAVKFSPGFNPSPAPLRRRYFIVRANLPFPKHQAKYHKELEAAIDAVDRACRLCVDVKRSLFSSNEKIVEKNDQTPVTIADFGVQALISLELSKLFPSIPLVAEEDSHFVRANNLVSSVVSEVKSKASIRDNELSDADVLEAIDRGGKDAYAFCNKPATYWVLDPIDGTKMFLQGDEALYVVGLALVVDNEIVLGVMGCPNWPGDLSDQSNGTLMLSHTGCGTWTKRLQNITGKVTGDWTRCFVDASVLVNKSKFCIQESQPWESLPLSGFFDAKTVSDDLQHKDIILLSTSSGSLGRYMMVASGRASVYYLRARTQRTLKAWDHVVGIICVHEAGGKVGEILIHRLKAILDTIYFLSISSKRVLQIDKITTWFARSGPLLMILDELRNPTKLKEEQTFLILMFMISVCDGILGSALSPQVTDWEGDEINLEEDQSERRDIFPVGGILASNGSLHNQILEMIPSASPTL